MNMYNWIEKMIYGDKKALPVLSFPSVQSLYITVKELVASSAYQAMGMKLIADRYDMPASLTFMDLSVEAEAFGARAVYGTDDVPTITGKLVADEAAAVALNVPAVGAGRTGVNIDTVRKALMLINDRPVLAGCIGPFSLAGRLMNVNDALINCYEEPAMVHILLRKATDFLIQYIHELKLTGAHGVIIAEPLAGLLSPDLMREFSTEYVREMVSSAQSKNFIVIYHNCGNAVNHLVNEILDTGCMAFHFGESADMLKMLQSIPRNFLVMGNISASAVFNNGTEQQMRLATTRLLEKCGKYNNFVISSGCDIPPITDLDIIDMFFETTRAFYYRKSLWEAIT